MDIPALKVNQWLPTWDKVHFDDSQKRSKPKESFYIFSIDAVTLKKLSGVYRRKSKNRKSASQEFGIQRKHDPVRSSVILEYVMNGYPWSELSQRKRESGQFDDLKKPGWLPTSIVINILKSDDVRRKQSVNKNDLVKVEEDSSGTVKINLPDTFNRDNWEYQNLPPIEIIDGQHRLWAFEDVELDDKFELPVVAFHGLDLSWQAYLFYTINISPKKINRSLAYDLYPLLRTEDWLEKFEGHLIYREARAQEIVDYLYSHDESPWNNWINMLGETGENKMNSQSAWIRSLLATLIKTYDSRGNLPGGLFGAKKGDNETVLPWGKEEQVALILLYGNKILEKCSKSNHKWIKEINNYEDLKNRTPAFYGKTSLLNHDQGIRALFYILNDFLFTLYDELELENTFLASQSGNSYQIISNNIAQLRNKKPIDNFLNNLCDALVKFDWRSYSNNDLNADQKTQKAGYRGSGGYKVLRIDLLRFIYEDSTGGLKDVSKTILSELEN